MGFERGRSLLACVIVAVALAGGAARSRLRVGTEFQVNTYTASDQNKPVMAVDARRRLRRGLESQGQDGSLYGLFAQRFSRTGAPQGAELQVSLLTSFQQFNSSVAMAPTGASSWPGRATTRRTREIEMFARRFSSAGVALRASSG